MNDKIYVLGDADHIRRKIDGLLLSNDLEGLSSFSNKITMAIRGMSDWAARNMNARIVFCGGDDIFFVAAAADFHEAEIRDQMKRFANQTGSTISFGVGRSAEEAFLNLARAKSSGSGELIACEGLAENG